MNFFTDNSVFLIFLFSCAGSPAQQDGINTDRSIEDVNDELSVENNHCFQRPANLFTAQFTTLVDDILLLQ